MVYVYEVQARTADRSADRGIMSEGGGDHEGGESGKSAEEIIQLMENK
jgi:hypothetical protein